MSSCKARDIPEGWGGTRSGDGGTTFVEGWGGLKLEGVGG